MEQLRDIPPLIVIDPFESMTTTLADLQIPVAVTGIDAEGTAYRMDGIPIKIKKAMDSAYPPSDTEILTRIYDRMLEVKGL